MSDSDPIRALAAARRPTTYRLPEYIRPTFPTPTAIPLESLTPGGYPVAGPTPTEVFARFLHEMRDGVYGA